MDVRRRRPERTILVHSKHRRSSYHALLNGLGDGRFKFRGHFVLFLSYTRKRGGFHSCNRFNNNAIQTPKATHLLTYQNDKTDLDVKDLRERPREWKERKTPLHSCQCLSLSLLLSMGVTFSPFIVAEGVYRWKPNSQRGAGIFARLRSNPLLGVALSCALFVPNRRLSPHSPNRRLIIKKASPTRAVSIQ